jgi:ketosteroid isomerase-like protein
MDRAGEPYARPDPFAEAVSVSEQNVDVVREALAAYARRDREALRALNDPGVEVDWSRSRGWLAAVYRGIEDAFRFYDGYFEVFESIVLEAEDYVVAGDSVVVPNVARSRGRHGAEVTARSAIVFTLRDLRVIRVCLYQETDEALEAVGLRP